MSVYKPEGSPYWHYDFQRGGRRFYGSTKKTTRGQAEAHERRLIAKAETHSDEGKEVSLDVAAHTYYEQVAKWQNSAVTTDYQIENLIRLLDGSSLLSEIGDSEVAEMVAKRRAERSRRARKAHGKTCRCIRCLVGPATVNRELELLRRIIYRARDVDGAKVKKIKWAKHKLIEPDAPDRPLTEAQEERLFNTMALHLRPIVEMSLLTGLRMNNVVGLDWKQIDMRGRTITVKMKSRRPGGKTHIVEFSEPLLVLLANLGPKDSGRVFTYGPPCQCTPCRQKRFQGKPVRAPRTAWEAARRRAGLPEFRFHDLRHTVGSRILARGFDLKAAKDFLGHASIASTVRYAHHAPGIKRDIMDAISAPDSRNIPEVRADKAKK